MKKQIITVVLLLFVGVSIVIAMSDVAGWRTNSNTDEATAANSNTAGIVSQQKDGLTAIYFHAKHRCPTCEKIEAFAHDALKTEIEQGNIGWAVADYTTQENQAAVEHCKVLASTVVLVDLKNGEIVRWKNLEKVWDYTHDPKAFETYMDESWTEFKNAS